MKNHEVIPTNETTDLQTSKNRRFFTVKKLLGIGTMAVAGCIAVAALKALDPIGLLGIAFLVTTVILAKDC